MQDLKLKMSPPWVTIYNQINALFGPDPDILISYDNDEPKVIITVTNPEKAAALNWVLPEYYPIGNLWLDIEIDAVNGMTNRAFFDKKELFDVLFDRNPVYAFSYSVDGIFSNSIIYVVFKNKVVQFFNDNLGDIYGNVSTLYQEIAKDLFNYREDFYNVCYCTDKEEKVGKPLGEWP